MWVRIDDQMTSHPKVVKAGPEAAWLFVCGLTYCASQLTDGFIPSDMLSMLSKVRRPVHLATRLVEVGLWECVEGGYQVHDYLVYQPSAEQVRAIRAADRERRRSKNPAGTQPDSDRRPDTPSLNPHPAPTRPTKSTPQSELKPPKPPADAGEGVSSPANGKVSGGGEASLVALAEAFASHGLERPALVGFEERHAKSLLQHFEPWTIARVWADVESGALGTPYDRDHLSFQYMAAHNRVGKWQRERDAVLSTPADTDLGTVRRI